MALQFTTSYLDDVRSLFAHYKRMGEAAMAQVSDADLTRTLDPEMNSIAQIAKHMAGNMRSRWTGFPEADGEKPSRNRDSEFEAPPATRAELMKLWEAGWACIFAALDPLSDADLARDTFIRGERHSVVQAINRQLAHYSYHLGQIVFLAKHLQSANWKSLSVPRGGSAGFNADVAAGRKSQR
ncbi:MAG TPA: DUF1572 domain-containing protein [Acidobacteriaceae bacterium]|jgi:hypothetical protein